MERYLTKKEAADALGVNPRTVERYLMGGRLKGALIGKAWRIAESNVEAFMRAEEDVTGAALKGKDNPIKARLDTSRARAKKAADAANAKKTGAKKGSVKKTAGATVKI